MIKLLIFDLDGTLADTLDAITRALNITMEHFGFPTHSYEQARKMIGNGAKNLVRISCPEGTFEGEGGEARFEEIYKFYSATYDKTYLDTDHPYDGLYDVLEDLKRKCFTLAVLSNKPDHYTKDIVAQIFRDGLFSHVQGQTNMPVKPDPTAPHYIAKNFGVLPNECAFIGDSDVDVKTAKNSGMFSLAVSWGFRDKNILESLEPDAIADTPEQLGAILTKLKETKI